MRGISTCLILICLFVVSVVNAQKKEFRDLVVLKNGDSLRCNFLRIDKGREYLFQWIDDNGDTMTSAVNKQYVDMVANLYYPPAGLPVERALSYDGRSFKLHVNTGGYFSIYTPIIVRVLGYEDYTLLGNIGLALEVMPCYSFNSRNSVGLMFRYKYSAPKYAVSFFIPDEIYKIYTRSESWSVMAVYNYTFDRYRTKAKTFLEGGIGYGRQYDRDKKTIYPRKQKIDAHLASMMIAFGRKYYMRDGMALSWKGGLSYSNAMGIKRSDALGTTEYSRKAGVVHFDFAVGLIFGKY